ncbi:response regulator [Candidatus Daviesbacteria bacterium]|nr:response regulator [Candidatus Daviesbacteria bacterium]
MGKILLIIEDDPYVQRVYQRLFTGQDYTLEIASSGQEGLDKAKKLKPTLILLDIIMPGMDGFQVLGVLKKDFDLKDIPVVVLTNLGDDESIKKAISLGADSFMVKANFEPEAVKKKIEAYIKEES